MSAEEVEIKQMMKFINLMFSNVQKRKKNKQKKNSNELSDTGL